MLKILLADDDPVTLKCLEKYIHWSELNCELTDIAINGAIAHDIAIEKDVDVIITDIKMPIMDGVELCKKLRENNHNVSIVFLSAYDDFHTAQIAMHYQVSDYILKPITPDTIKKLETILRKISEDRKNKKTYISMINSTNFTEYARKALSEENLIFFNSFIEEIKQDTNVDFYTVQIIGIKLLDIIYDFLYNAVNTPSVESKQRRINTLLSLNNTNAILEYILTIYQSVFQHASTSPQKNYDMIVKSIQKYIQDNYQNNCFGVSNVANHFFFSVPHINRIFKDSTGITISDYISKLRMDKAIELLTQSNLSINKIAQRVGFSSDNYFIRIFKNRYHITPNEYRRKQVIESS